jgi:hypothetical protein
MSMFDILSQVRSMEIHAFHDVLAARGIFYAPHYAINAGGLINVAQEYRGYDAELARQKTLAVYDTIAEIARRSIATGVEPGTIADRIVDETLARARAVGPDQNSMNSPAATPIDAPSPRSLSPSPAGTVPASSTTPPNPHMNRYSTATPPRAPRS